MTMMSRWTKVSAVDSVTAEEPQDESEAGSRDHSTATTSECGPARGSARPAHVRAAMRGGGEATLWMEEAYTTLGNTNTITNAWPQR